jgi:hypothetical protein
VAETPEQQQRRIALAQQEYEQAQLRREELEREGASRAKLAEALAAQAKAEENLARAQGLTGQALRDFTRDAEIATEAAKNLGDATSDFDKALKRNIKTFTGITDKSDGLIGSFLNLRKQTGDNKAGLEQLRKTLEETITGFNVGMSVVDKFVQGSIAMTVAMDEATAGFAKATGLGKTFHKQIQSLEKSNRQFGVTAGESAAAFQGLVDGLSGFALESEGVQSALAEEVAQLSELGVSSADTVGSMQTLTTAFGFAKEETLGFTKQTETLAQELGISLGEAIGNVNQALPKLAALSKDQVGGALKRLQEQAVETGIAMGGLIDIADRFDTFDEAATAAGNLNAVLGTQMFDTMGLLEAQMEGPQAFIDTFGEQLRNSVGSFEELTVFQKKAIANASGLSTVELRQLFNQEEITEEQKKQAETREKNLKSAMALKDELLALVAEMSVILMPIIKGLKFIVGGFAKVVKSLRFVGDKLSFGKAGGVTAMAGTAALGYGAGKLANFGLKKLGLKGEKQKVNPDGSINVRIVGDETGGAGDIVENVLGDGDGLGGSMKKWFNKQKGKLGFGLKKDAAGRFRDARGRFASAPKFNLAGGLGRVADFGASMKGKVTGRLAGLAGKLGGGKLFAKLGARAIPGLGTAMLAFDAAKFLGPKLLKGVKSLGPALLGGVKKFGGATLGLLKRASAVPRKIVGGVLKGGMGILKGIGRGVGGAFKKLKFWADGTDNTSSNKVGIAGERGPELIVPPPKSAVINNTAMTNAALGAMSMGPALNDLATAVSKLNDRPIEVTTNPVMVERTLNQAMNKYNGAPGSSPASGM